jgi:hypothetical protein
MNDVEQELFHGEDSLPLTKVWTPDELDALIAYLTTLYPSFRGASLNRGTNKKEWDFKPKFNGTDPTLFHKVLYAQCEDLPILIRITSMPHLPVSSAILRWRLENGI